MIIVSYGFICFLGESRANLKVTVPAIHQTRHGPLVIICIMVIMRSQWLRA